MLGFKQGHGGCEVIQLNLGTLNPGFIRCAGQVDGNHRPHNGDNHQSDQNFDQGESVF